MGDLHYLSAFAELPVTDLEASVRWYESVVGFHRIAAYRFERGRGVHMRRSDGQDVVLRDAGGGSRGEARGSCLTLNFATDSDLAELSTRARIAGAERTYIPHGGPEDPEALEFTDPDGHVLRFFPREIPHAIVR